MDALIAPTAVRRRSTGTMIMTSLVWHVVVMILVWALVPLISTSCQTDCNDSLETFFVIVWSIPALMVSWVTSVTLIVAATRRALVEGVESGEPLAPANRGQDVWTATWITGAGIATGVLAEAVAIAIFR